MPPERSDPRGSGSQGAEGRRRGQCSRPKESPSAGVSSRQGGGPLCPGEGCGGGTRVWFPPGNPAAPREEWDDIVEEPPPASPLCGSGTVPRLPARQQAGVGTRRGVTGTVLCSGSRVPASSGEAGHPSHEGTGCGGRGETSDRAMSYSESKVSARSYFESEVSLFLSRSQ